MYHRASGLSRDCRRCTLSNCPVVHGQSEVPLDEVRLVVVSAYPGVEELRQGITLANSPKTLNAGGYCRRAISTVFDNDESIPLDLKPFVSYTFFTNAIRCSPSIGKTKREVTKEHLESCSHWLFLELSQVPPTTPILVASSEALKTLLGPDHTIYSSRCRVWKYKEHPVVVTMNPIEALRYHPYEVVTVSKSRSGVEVPKSSRMAKPILGSVPYLFKQDLLLIKSLVIKGL